MRFGIDATPLVEPAGGVARYTWELARALAERFPDDEYWLLSDQSLSVPGRAPANLRVGDAPHSALERRWWLYGLNRELSRRNVDVFHGADFAVPYWHRRPAVMTVHDLSPWKYPQWQPAADRVRSRTPRMLKLGLADRVITPSEAVRREVIEYFAMAPERVVAVPLAARAELQPAEPYRHARPYFLFVGTLEPRKNIPRLVEAWREVRRSHDVDLLLVGRARRDFTAPAHEPGLHLLGAVPDAKLPALYSGAVACVYPSLYEGFGLPVLEAMQCGAAVITSCDPAITEVAGGAAVQVPAEDTGALVQALALSILCSGQIMDKKMDKKAAGLRRAAEFSWRETARRTREVYLAAAGVVPVA